jgi:hypothetical protein
VPNDIVLAADDPIDIINLHASIGDSCQTGFGCQGEHASPRLLRKRCQADTSDRTPVL